MKKIIIGLGFVEQHLNSKFDRSNFRFQPNDKSINDFIEKERPDAIINCLGKTGRPNIDQCELDKIDTVEKNVIIPTLLAQACERRGISLLHIGSGCIFSGTSPSPNGWREDDAANPQSFYSKTKYSCDLAIQDFESVCILRIRMPISRKYLERNFITKVLGYESVIDIPNSVTFMDDLERAVNWSLDKSLRGTYHLTNPGAVTAADVARQYQKITNHQFKIISEEQLQKITKAKRSNCILDNSKFIKTGFEFSQDSNLINSYVQSYFKSKSENK